MTFPRIDLLRSPADATELILLAHGGQEASLAPTGDWRAPILRMWPFASVAISAARGSAVGLMRYRYQGWNGAEAHASTDLRAVLDRLPARITRVLLIGHSMGGRAVVAVSNHPLVDRTLALAPWLPAGEPLVKPQGPVVMAHGTADRVTSPALTAAYAKRLRKAGTPVALIAVDGSDHTMLGRSADWNALVRDFVQGTAGALTTDADHLDQLPRSGRAEAPLHGVLEIAKSRLRRRVVGQF
ncbi:alpha/beta hydrolase family protein [Kribbella sp. CA-293567]|uniref:alpha/beta hydrolase family protein n=1 Tax=Kribbella sp. CA-293567 TaxID=3002436 RepID=UPI0022DD30EA|nr:alpha/beta fold hydrolase [Kribbella sp. CA-293567]WBQ06459.1 alpha/beta fold hydrolase [Kribbella sp. CA-293567]